MKKLSALDIAKYFLILVDRDEGDAMTHLKLQKLIYFAQGVSLACTDTLLFDEPMMAWPHGPVSSSVYSHYKIFAQNAIPQPPEMDFDIYDQSIKNLICKVYNFYGGRTASYLRNLSHEHIAWKNANNSDDKTIDYNDVKTDFANSEYMNNLDVSNIEKQAIIDAEDQWWMSYDCGVPSEDITERLLEHKALFEKDPQTFINSCTPLEDII